MKDIRERADMNRTHIVQLSRCTQTNKVEEEQVNQLTKSLDYKYSGLCRRERLLQRDDVYMLDSR